MADSVANLLLRITGETGDADRSVDELIARLEVLDKTHAEGEADVKTDKGVLKIAAFQAMLDHIDGQKVTVEGDFNQAAADAKIAAFDVLLSTIDGRKVTVKADVNTGAATTKLAAFRAAVSALTDSSNAGSKGFSLYSIGLSGLIAIAGALIPIIAALGSYFLALAVSLGAAIAAVGALSIALGGAFVAGAALAAGAIARFKAQANTAGTAAHALKTEAQDLFKSFKSATATGADAVFRGLARAMAALQKPIAALKPAFTTLGKAWGQAFGNLGHQLAAIVPQFGQLVKESAPLAGPLTRAFGNLLEIFIHIARAAMPLLVQGVRMFADWLGKIAGRTGDLGHLRGIISEIASHLAAWWNLLTGIMDIFVQLFKAIGPIAREFVQSLGDGAHALADWIKNNPDKVQHFFETMKPLISEVGKFIGLLVQVLLQFAQEAAPIVIAALKLINQALAFLKDHPAILKFAAALAVMRLGWALLAGTLKFFLGWMTKIPAIINLVRAAMMLLGPAVAGAFRAFGGLITMLGGLAGRIATAIATWIGPAAAAAGRVVAGIVTGFVGLVGRILTAIATGATALAARIAAWIAPAAAAAGRVVAAIVAPFYALATRIAAAVAAGGAALAARIAAWAVAAGAAARGVVAAIMAGLSGLAARVAVAIGTAGGSIGGAIAGWATRAAGSVGGFIANIGGRLAAGVPSIIARFGAAFGRFAVGGAAGIALGAQLLGKFIAEKVGIFFQNSPLGQMFSDGFTRAFNTAKNAISDAAHGIVHFVTNIFNTGGHVAGDTFGKSFANSIQNARSTVAAKAKDIVKVAADNAKRNATSGGRSAGNALGTSVANGIRGGSGKAKSAGGILGAVAALGVRGASGKGRAAGTAVSGAAGAGVLSGGPKARAAGHAVGGQAGAGVQQAVPAAHSSGASFVAAFANAIRAGISFVVNAVRAVAAAAKAQLPRSEPKDPRSPLRGLTDTGIAFSRMIATGIRSGGPQLVDATRSVLLGVRNELGELRRNADAVHDALHGMTPKPVKVQDWRKAVMDLSKALEDAASKAKDTFIALQEHMMNVQLENSPLGRSLKSLIAQQSKIDLSTKVRNANEQISDLRKHLEDLDKEQASPSRTRSVADIEVDRQSTLRSIRDLNEQVASDNRSFQIDQLQQKMDAAKASIAWEIELAKMGLNTQANMFAEHLNWQLQQLQKMLAKGEISYSAFVTAVKHILGPLGVSLGVGQETEMALRGGKGFMENFAHGMLAAAGVAKDALKQILNDLKGMLPGSEPRDHASPLYGLRGAGEQMMRQIAVGLPIGGRALQAALQVELQKVSLDVNAGLMQPAASGPSEHVDRRQYIAQFPPAPASQLPDGTWVANQFLEEMRRNGG